MSGLIFAVQYRHGGLILLNLAHCQNYFSLPPFSHTSVTHYVLVSISLITALLHLDKQLHKKSVILISQFSGIYWPIFAVNVY